jgi:hypothetical protein
MSAAATVFGPSGYQEKSAVTNKVNALSQTQREILLEISELNGDEMSQIVDRRREVDKEKGLIIASFLGERMPIMFEAKK